MNTRELNPQGKFEGWSTAKVDQLKTQDISQDVGTLLIYQDRDIRVWQVNLLPGERLPFHQHTTDYTWVALTAGKAVSHFENGKIDEITYQRGDCYFYHHSHQGDFIHDLENTGKRPLIFSTVEYKPESNKVVDQ